MTQVIASPERARQSVSLKKHFRINPRYTKHFENGFPRRAYALLGMTGFLTVSEATAFGSGFLFIALVVSLL